MIVIDGSYGEGGGQILRMTLALSAATGRPVKIINIRAKRDPPGLKAQHMTAVKAVAALVGAEVEGLKKGSTTLTFIPRKIRSGRFFFDVGTAGSISLVLQALLPVLALVERDTQVTIRGGTAVSWSPPIKYLEKVFIPHLSKMGFTPQIKVLKHGFYPRGGGLVSVMVKPVSKLGSINALERGEIVLINGISESAKLPGHVPKRQAKAAESYLRLNGYDHLPISINIRWRGPDLDQSLGPGSYIVLWAISDKGAIIGSDALGAKGKPAEKVGEEAALKLIEELKSNAPIDQHMGDHLIIWMALAHGISKIKVSKLTMHTYTCMYVIREMLESEVHVENGEIGDPAIITVKGKGVI